MEIIGGLKDTKLKEDNVTPLGRDDLETAVKITTTH